MASHALTDRAQFTAVLEGATSLILRLIPQNDAARRLSDAWMVSPAGGSKTSVVFTQQDAGHDGAGQTSEPYQSLVVTTS
jgi:hypothetical protein